MFGANTGVSIGWLGRKEQRVVDGPPNGTQARRCHEQQAATHELRILVADKNFADMP